MMFAFYGNDKIKTFFTNAFLLHLAVIWSLQCCAAPFDQFYTYDAANRLTSANSTTYTLDNAGNLREIAGSVGPSLSLPATFSSTSGAQSGLTVSVASNVSWTAASNQSWLTITGGSSGSGNGAVTFSLGENVGGVRSAEIRATQVGGGLSAVCTVTQAGATPSLPDILVEQGGAVSNDGSRSFGSVAVGSSNSLTFTVRNTGQGTLSGLSISKSGANGPDYSVGALGNVTLPANGSSTFTVDFAPSGTGPRSATIDIASNDPDENPYRIHLSGTGTSTGGGGTPGTLDTSFGSGGKMFTAFGLNSAWGNAVAVQSDDKIIVAGSTYDGAKSYFAIARYLPNGVLDPDFGLGGRVTTGFGGPGDAAYAVAVQADGKILAAGSTSTNGWDDFVVARYLQNGSVDPAFGIGGHVITSLSSGGDRARGIAIQNDGKILLAGETDGLGFGVIRHNGDGTLDNGFGNGGKATLNFTALGSSATCIAVQADGRVVVAGSSYQNYSNQDLAVARFNADGTVDTGFGTGGKVTTAIGNSHDGGMAVAIQVDGKIVVGGHSMDGSWNDFAMVRYTGNGALDTSFGSGGAVITPIGGENDVGRALVLENSGKIVVAGFASNGIDSDFCVARYNSNGSLDNAFGTSGKAITPVGSYFDEGTGAALQSDGAIIVAGTSVRSGASDFSLVRYVSGVDTHPRVTTSQPGTTTSTSAVLAGNVISPGSSAVTERGIVYSTAPYPTLGPANNVTAGSGTGSFAVTVSNLASGTTFYGRAYAVNGGGIGYGSVVRFATDAAPVTLPSVTTASPGSVTHNSAVVGGNVTNSGGSAVTERGIDFAAWQWPVGYLVERRTSGSGAGSFNVNLSDLSPNTTYYYRAYAVNSAGLAYDETLKSFTTAASPSPTPARIYNQQLLSNLSGGQGTSTYYVIAVPKGQRTLRIESYGGTGDANLYVSFGRIAVRGASDYESTRGANDELISIDSPAAGDYFILVHSLTSTAGVSLRASFLPPSPPALRIYGPRNIRTSRASVALRGASTDPDGDLAWVKFRLSGPWRTASGLASWSANAVLKPGNNRIQVEAGDRTGRRSPIQQVRVFRR